MKLTIFSRLVVGYMIIFLLVMAANIYVIFQLGQFYTFTQSILGIDNRILELHTELTNALLSQIENEKKFIILKDQTLYEQYLEAKNDFNKHHGEIVSLAHSVDDKSLLDRMKHLGDQYHSLFDEEITYINAGGNYLQDWYKGEKERILNEIALGLRQLKYSTQNNTYEKITKIVEAGEISRKVAVIITISFLILGVAISVVITRSITNPLSVVKKKIGDIAKGDFENDLHITSPPEIKELSHAFNFMCQRLKEVDKMKSDFFSLMSHELRTPLTSIKEGTYLLCEGLAGEITDKQRRILSILAEESNRLIALVNSLLDLSKIEAGMLAYNFTQADLTPLIHKAVIEIMPLAEAKNIRIDRKIKELPPIEFDTEKILQVLRNLIGNAVKFTPDGGHVTVTGHPYHDGIKVSVSDTGPGIKREHLATIFDKFQQVTMTNSSKLKGTGVGLAIVKHIINSHGGKVWAESKVTQGSTFIFVLPA